MSCGQAEQPVLLLLAVSAADGQVIGPPLAVIGALRVLTTESRQILFHGGASVGVRQRRSESSMMLDTKGLLGFQCP